MEFKPLKHPTLEDAFTDRIEHMILRGVFKPNDKLPSERDLAQQMDISKTVVHSGMKRLARLGFVYVNGNQGTFVNNYLESGTLEVMNDIIFFHGGDMDETIILSLLELRLAIESPQIKKLAEHHNPTALAALQSMIDALCSDVAAKSLTDFECAVRIFQFHHYISRAGESIMFPLVLNTFKEIALIFGEDECRLLGQQKAVNQTQALLDLIAEGNGDGTVALLEQQFNLFFLNKTAIPGK
ncbi:MAG: GntR family transcriptional regulator [Ruthenibacterium sp.]